MIGLETAVPLVITELILKENFSWTEVIAKMTVNPAQIIHENLGVVKPGAVADLTIINPEKKWRLIPERIRSRSKNSPWLNKELTGQVQTTIVAGEIKYILD